MIPAISASAVLACTFAWPTQLAVQAFAWPFWGPDPAPSLSRTKESTRRLDCTHLSPEAARVVRPGIMPAERPRGDYVDRQVIHCQERVLKPGIRRPLDDATLATLDLQVAELATTAVATRPDLAERTWLVESFYPGDDVAPKISFAAKNALMNKGASVSDRTPVLAAGDLEILTRMPPEEAYPAACRRYVQAGGLRDTDALLAIVHRDPRERILHAGVCADGGWQWVR